MCLRTYDVSNQYQALQYRSQREELQVATTIQGALYLEDTLRTLQ